MASKGTKTYEFMTSSSDAGLSASSIWGGFKDRTTSHGIPHITLARGVVKKAFWGVITFLCLGALGYHFTTVFMTYFAYRVNVNVAVYHQREALFPAVTICNMNPVKKSALSTSPLLQSVLNGSSKRKKRDLSNHRQKRATPVCMNSCIDPSTGICYYSSISDGTFSQTDASSYCTNRSSQLAVVSSDSIRTFIDGCGAISAISGLDRLWIGLSRQIGPWTFQWGNGDNYSYTNWQAGHPESWSACVAMGKNTKWQSENCSTNNYALCETTGVTTSVVTTIPTTSASVTTSDFTTTIAATTTAAQTTVTATTAAQTTVAATTAAPTTTSSSGPQPIPGSQYSDRLQTRESFQTESRVSELLSDLPPSEQFSLGFTPSEFILDCMFSGVSCYLEEFEHFYNSMHGNCYVFNSGWNSTKKKYTSFRTGRRFGLSLILNIQQDEYLDGFGEEAGARLVIHDQVKMPFPEEEGIIVSPGAVTSVGIQKLVIKRMASPYGNCTDAEASHASKNVFEEAYPVQYSSMACLKTCYQKHLINTCGCSDPLVPKYGKAFDYVDVNSCDTKNITQDDCKYGVGLLYQNDELDCYCPHACKDSYYTPRLSQARWPADAYVDTLHTRLDSVVPDIMTDPNDTDKFRRNLLKLEIYYEEFNYEKIEEKPAYSPVQFVSDIGGMLGLWMGFSVLTIFEFIELLMDLIGLSCVKSAPAPRRSMSREKTPVKSRSISGNVQQTTRKFSRASDPEVVSQDSVTPTLISRSKSTVSVTHGVSHERPVRSPPPSYTSLQRTPEYQEHAMVSFSW